MNAPRRLLQDGTDFERQLLASARLDVASPRKVKRALAAVGTLAAFGSASGAGAASGSATGIAGAGLSVLVKWVGLGMIVGVGATGTARLLTPPSVVPRETRIASSMTAPMEVLARAPDPAATTAEETITIETASPLAPDHATAAGEPAGEAQPVRVRSASRHAEATSPSSTARHAETMAPEPSSPERAIASPAATTSPADLTAEISALAAVRAALGQGNAVAALFQLEAYRRAFPRGALDDEATVLEVNALSLGGDRAAAALVARRYLAAHPASPHAPRLRALAGDDNNR
jgi:hypothetical protein